MIELGCQEIATMACTIGPSGYDRNWLAGKMLRFGQIFARLIEGNASGPEPFANIPAVWIIVSEETAADHITAISQRQSCQPLIPDERRTTTLYPQSVDRLPNLLRQGGH